MVFTGGSTRIASKEAGGEAAALAIKGASFEEKPVWALAFCSGRHDPEAVLAGIRKEIGHIPVFGGAACGIITNTLLDYSGYACGIAVFCDGYPIPKMFFSENSDSGEVSAGESLAACLDQNADAGDTVLLLFDQLKKAEPLELFSGSRLLEGIYSNPGMAKLNILGAGLVGDFNFIPSFIFDGDGVTEHAAIALVFPGCMQVDTAIMHGCTPVSTFLEITRMEGPVVLELDNRRALDVFHEMLGYSRGPETETIIPFTTTLANKSEGQWTPYSEQSYINSLVIGSDSDAGSVILFETDLCEGTPVQIMIRDNSDMLESSRKGAERMLAGVDEKGFAFYIDCAGRTRDYSSSDRDEADLVRQVIGDRIPLLGFYSSMEIAPYKGRSRPLNWTGILSVFHHE